MIVNILSLTRISYIFVDNPTIIQSYVNLAVANYCRQLQCVIVTNNARAEILSNY